MILPGKPMFEQAADTAPSISLNLDHQIFKLCLIYINDIELLGWNLPFKSDVIR